MEKRTLCTICTKVDGRIFHAAEAIRKAYYPRRGYTAYSNGRDDAGRMRYTMKVNLTATECDIFKDAIFKYLLREQSPVTCPMH